MARLATVHCATLRNQSAVRRFLDEGDERRMREADERRRRREARLRQEARRGPRSLPEDPEERDKLLSKIEFAKKRRENYRHTVESRLNDGYVWVGGYVGDQWQERFRFEGLRSEDHPLLRAFVARLPRAEKGLHSGYHKAHVEEGDSKLLMLDEPYVTGGTQAGYIREDLDTEWPSWAHLRHALVEADVPLPHFGVAYVRPDGTVVRPHLIWLLEHAVRFDAKAFAKPQALYRGVARGLCAKLVPLGGDPGALVGDSGRVKNPLSPHWGVAILSEDAPYSLGELADNVDAFVRLPAVHEAASTAYAATAAGIGACDSNNAFKAFRDASFETLRAWCRHGDERLDVRDAAATERRLVDALGVEARAALKGGSSPRAAMGLLRRVARFAVLTFDPSLVGKAVRDNKGIMRAELNAAGIHDVRDRQRRGQSRTSKVRRSRTVNDLLATMQDLGGPEAASKAEVSRKSGVPYRTLLRRWDEAVEAYGKPRETKASSECATGGIVRTLGRNPAWTMTLGTHPYSRSIPEFLTRRGRDTVCHAQSLAGDDMPITFKPLASRGHPIPSPVPSSPDGPCAARHPSSASPSRRSPGPCIRGRTTLLQATENAPVAREARPAVPPGIPSFLRKGRRTDTVGTSS